MSFPSTFDLILKFAVALGQSFGDDICATGHIKRALMKYCVTDFEFVLGHDDTPSSRSSNDGSLSLLAE
jgi:hypothetical protein